MKEIHLDKYQLEVVKAQNNLLVIAGPGSGKTTTIIEKINFLLKDFSPEEILVISFTNKSVDDIKKKISANVQVMTFHKLAADIIKYNNINYSICSNLFLSNVIDSYFNTLNKKALKKISKLINVKKFNNSDKKYTYFKQVTESFIKNFKTNNYSYNKISSVYQNTKYKFLLILIVKIYSIYEKEKESQGLLDYDDLIIKATMLLKNNYYYKKFSHVIVDEFQDTSMIRLNLIKKICDYNKAIITAVGDDAQSIYRFSGCNLNIFLNFSNYFKNSSIVFLKNTYRNSQEIINITEGFINKNPFQIPKNMIGKITNNIPIVIIKYINEIKAFKKVLINISKKTKDILVLGRNKNDIYNYMDTYKKIDEQYYEFCNIIFKYLTIHSSKGLESEYVILLNVSNKITGLPSQIENHEIINNILEKDEYPYAEERRVFFVALTRCKEKTYILTPLFSQSIFIKEIITLINKQKKLKM